MSDVLPDKVIVRCKDAGVHYGTLINVEGRQVTLADARRIWAWKGAFTLSEVAMLGINKTGSRVAMRVPLQRLLDASEIINCTQEAVDRIEACNDKG